MGQYSEMMGSFIRTGNYPLEANYIFESQQDLINFYNDPINRTTLHAGLFRIVRGKTEDQQALYWAVHDEDGFLYFKKLIDYNTFENIEDLVERIEQEIKDRQSADEQIWGTRDISEIKEELNSIFKLSEAVSEIQNKKDVLKKELKAILGTEEDDIITYLKTLNYKSLTELSEVLNKFLNTIDDEDVTINTLPELQKFLEGFEYTHNLYECFKDLWNLIEGDPLPNTSFRTLRGIQDFVETLASIVKNRTDNLQTELDQTQVGIGLSGDGSYNADQETYYLKNATSVMNALKVLDSLINQAINNCNIQSKNTNTVSIDINKEVDKTTISADIILSPNSENDLQAKDNGLYHHIDSEYENGVLTIKVNGNIRKQHVLGLSSIVDKAYYDPTQESIIIVFKLQDGVTQTTVIPVSTLISEWEVDNSQSTKVVELTKERVIGNGSDKLSGDVRLSSNKYNILEKDVNSLLVKGTADNIVYDGDITVKLKLDQLVKKDSEIDNTLSTVKTDISDEIIRAKTAEKDIQTILDNEIARSKEKDESLTITLNEEIERAKTAENDNYKRINKEINRAKQAEDNLGDSVVAETNRATTAENALDSKYAIEIATSRTNEQNLSDKLTDEIARSTNKDSELESKIESERDRALEQETNLNANLQSEITRATNVEAVLQGKIDNLQEYLDLNTDNDNSIATRVKDLETNLIEEKNRASVAETDLSNQIALETERASNKEAALDHRIDDVKDLIDSNSATTNTNKQAIDDIIAKNLQQDSEIAALDDKIDLIKDNVESNISTKITSLQDSLNQEISRSTSEDTSIKNSISELSTDIANEATRAKAEETVIRSEIEKEKERAEQKEDFIETRITDHINNSNNPHKVTAEQINVYTKDSVNTLLDGIKTTHVSDITSLTEKITDVKQDINNHLINYNNPHKVTKAQIGLDKVDNTSDVEKPISLATQTALSELNAKLNSKLDTSDLLTHIQNNNNPHVVTKTQVGLDKVDNTADIDKPISNATQIALDNKAEIIHTHKMSDIDDLENIPIIKGFVKTVGDLPEDPENDDKYILIQIGPSTTKYVLFTFNQSQGVWVQKQLSTNNIACVIDGDVYKLTNKGTERILDVSDYTYFYNKIYNETKDLIEDIDWEENDETSDTNQQIRLKITYKTKYEDPNESEVTNPYQTKSVKYIDIDKARFLSNAYSRPAVQSDIDNGYASTLGEPLLILIMTTGDHITISLKDALNIYDPIDTASIDMSVSDWTGISDTSYKVSGNVRLAEAQDKLDAVSLHILDGTEKGLYGSLHTENTNSITLNPSTGSNNSQKYLTANLNINSDLNNSSDVLLTIDSKGLSAKIVWGEYD